MQLAARAGRAARLGRASGSPRRSRSSCRPGTSRWQVHEYVGDLARFTPHDHAYGSIYFTLLGADHAHVALGLLFDLWLLAKLARGLTTYRLNALQAIALYWHAVNVITIVVTLTVLSPAL